MMKSVTICALVSLLCGCVPTYQNRPWADCMYTSRRAYVMQGTETIKTATLLTVDGTFKKFTFPVERRFDLSENGETQKKLGHFIHNGRDCGNSHYEFFPQLNTMVSLE